MSIPKLSILILSPKKITNIELGFEFTACDIFVFG